MFTLFKKKNPHVTSCLVCHALIAVLLFLAFIMSFVGVLMAHFDIRSGLMVFGSNAGSLSLISFVLCSTLFIKALKGCGEKCEMCGTNGKK